VALYCTLAEKEMTALAGLAASVSSFQAIASTPEVERERAAYIHSGTARHYTFLEGLQIPDREALTDGTCAHGHPLQAALQHVQREGLASRPNQRL